VNIGTNGSTTNVITLFDSLTATGTVICAITPGGTSNPNTLDFEIDFSIGLTVLIAGGITPSDVTIIYD
jgi:hypothetical protein